MNKFEIEIDFEKVNLSELETEEDFRTEAKKILPAGLYKFASGSFGADSSGESNTMAVSGTMTDTQDGPQNNFCTLSQLSRNYGTPPTIANGATTSTAGDN